jgi:signal transduction histidine kinase
LNLPAEGVSFEGRAFALLAPQNSLKFSKSGLALLIVKKIMEAHEGRLWLLSEPGKGTEFFFSLPVMP